MRPTAIPKGVQVLPPTETARLRWVQRTLLTIFHRWGFREILTPTFEYLEVFEGEGQATDHGEICKFVDRETGQLLALRPDLTPQVARMVATTLRHHPLPLRLAYSVPVFRHAEAHGGRAREFFQAGVELCGLARPEADAEMIAMAVEGCQAVGLKNFQIDVGQVEYLRGILQAIDPPEALHREVLSALRRKDPAALELLVKPLAVPDPLKEALLSLTDLYGGEEVLDRAERQAPTNASKAALANIRQVTAVLKTYGLAEHIIIDLGEAYAFNYHTGVVFQIFTESLGRPIGGGGRYDNLIGNFGEPCPATGFAFELEGVLEALESQGTLPPDRGPDFHIIDFHQDKRQALEIARTLRAAGYAVSRDIIQRDLDGSLAYAKFSAIPHTIILGAPGQPEGTLLLREVTSGRETSYPIPAFCRQVTQGELRWPT
ncbi:MAG: ATP phosphoribosyltransferase regulatory subunit [Candidatus Methylomirabilales bacterium]